MAQTKITNAQYPLNFDVQIDPEDIGNELVIDVQPGFVLLNVALAKRVAFDGTTPSITIVDNKTAPTTLLAANDLSSLVTPNAEAAIGVKYTEYPSGGKIRILPTGTTVTAGRADVIISGYVRGKQHERFGTPNAT